MKAKLQNINDHRKHREYLAEELVMAGILLFIFKQGSRNEMDNARKNQQFAENYKRIFHLRVPSLDAVEDFYRGMDISILETLKSELISALIEKKVFCSSLLPGKEYVIAVDGTGVYSSNKHYWDENVHQTSSKGKVTYMNNVLEAKLVMNNGAALSLCSEWIQNPADAEYDKQDCELKAFKRLAGKLKKQFPRLPVCLVVAGLYCNAPFMDICSDNRWHWIAVFKDGNLPSVHQELKLLPAGAFEQKEQTVITENTGFSYKWCNDIEYTKEHRVHWIECNQITTHKKADDEMHHFEYLTDIFQEKETVNEYVMAARRRWNIEESFNDKKNRGFEMQHLFSRHSFKAFCNWYQTLSIAHNIYLTVIKSIEVNEIIKQHKKLTVKHLWKNLMGWLSFVDTGDFMDELDIYLSKNIQVRLC